ncbi:MAG TPA: galactokinase family protein [Bacteroidota bacterium]|nr:galactokinase family protein [Bacteroidota bacterium]
MPSNSHTTLKVSTPGRVCLFGEHQDYLDLPVISCAISLRLTIVSHMINDCRVIVHTPDTGGTFSIPLDRPVDMERDRDFFRSGIKVMQNLGMTFSHGFECTIHGTIPISAGTSSSSAMLVSWMNLLGRLSDEEKILTPQELAVTAHAAEVVEFHGPGGKMDQYATAFGGVLYQSFFPHDQITELHPVLGTFVLGDSLQPKDTKSILSRVKNRVLDIVNRIRRIYPAFSLQTIRIEDLPQYTGTLEQEELELLNGTVRNRDFTREGFVLLQNKNPDPHKLGSLLSAQEEILRDILCISTPKIDRMVDAALGAGAFGGKINGSGGGGCMFAYAPEEPERIAEAIQSAGGRAYLVHPDEGSRLEPVT